MANADTALRVIEEIPSGSIDSELLHPQFAAWTISSSDLSGKVYLGFLKRFAGLFTPPLTITITGVTDGGDRVAIEATSHGTLPGGSATATPTTSSWPLRTGYSAKSASTSIPRS